MAYAVKANPWALTRCSTRTKSWQKEATLELLSPQLLDPAIIQVPPRTLLQTLPRTLPQTLPRTLPQTLPRTLPQTLPQTRFNLGNNFHRKLRRKKSQIRRWYFRRKAPFWEAESNAKQGRT